LHLLRLDLAALGGDQGADLGLDVSQLHPQLRVVVSHLLQLPVQAGQVRLGGAKHDQGTALSGLSAANCDP
jgi:hypothetical protein